MKKTSHNLLMWVLAVALALSLLANLLMILQEPDKDVFRLLDPEVSQMQLDEFLNLQEEYQLDYAPMRDEISEYLRSRPGRYGIYFEDLTTGAWMGINEREKFLLGSLYKVPLIAAILRNVEEGDIGLDDKVTVIRQDLDPTFGPLAFKGAGHQMTYGELLYYLTFYSDNTANLALRRTLEFGDFADAMLGMGIPYRNSINITDARMPLSAKDYSNVFRSLYLSTFLKRPSSNLALSLLVDTNFEEGLPAGVPSCLTVSHKVGVLKKDRQYHDCGIVYAKSPYIACVMTEGLSQDEAYMTIKEISGMIYKHAV